MSSADDLVVRCTILHLNIKGNRIVPIGWPTIGAVNLPHCAASREENVSTRAHVGVHIIVGDVVDVHNDVVRVDLCSKSFSLQDAARADDSTAPIGKLWLVAEPPNAGVYSQRIWR